MQKIMYLCPVDWCWIKQRPQFLAEELNAYFDVHVVYPYKNNRRGLQKKTQTALKLTPWFSVPTFSGKLKFIKKLNDRLLKQQIALAYRKIKPDILWVSMPWQIEFLPENVSCRIVYDCMDDYVAISTDQTDVKRLMNQEKSLVQRADVVFASSENLRMLLSQRYAVDLDRIQLLRNGYNANWSCAKKDSSLSRRKDTSAVRIGYFGTIGRWFDFELLLSSLKKYPQIEYHLFGPMEESVQIPQHERLIYRGVIEHDMIGTQAEELDALMMPFVVNDIVRSVDPVKLYEYIWMEKSILCVGYPEIERFGSFVLFYQDEEEFAQRIDSIVSGANRKYSHEQAVDFLLENNWKKRAEAAKYAIESI